MESVNMIPAKPVKNIYPVSRFTRNILDRQSVRGRPCSRNRYSLFIFFEIRNAESIFPAAAAVFFPIDFP